MQPKANHAKQDVQHPKLKHNIIFHSIYMTPNFTDYLNKL